MKSANRAAFLGLCNAIRRQSGQQIGTLTYCSQPFQMDVENLGAPVELRESLVDSNPKCPVAARQGDGIGFVRQVLRKHRVGRCIGIRGADQQKLVASDGPPCRQFCRQARLREGVNEPFFL